MATSPDTSTYFDWQSGYESALREYHNGSVGLKLDQAITRCISTLREFSSHDSDFSERRNCLTALSDLLVLRVLYYRYEAWSMTSEAKAFFTPPDPAD